MSDSVFMKQYFLGLSVSTPPVSEVLYSYLSILLTPPHHLTSKCLEFADLAFIDVTSISAIMTYMHVLTFSVKDSHGINSHFPFSDLPWLFTFHVKFYPPDPSQLTEDITR